MPLSEHEQRLLDQMEQALYSEDPKFASHMVGDPSRQRTRRRVLIGGAVLVIGLALVALGVVVTGKELIGGVGFAVMVAGGAYALTPGHRRTLGSVDSDGGVRLHEETGKSRKRGTRNSGASFMERIEQRWDKRRGEDGW